MGLGLSPNKRWGGEEDVGGGYRRAPNGSDRGEVAKVGSVLDIRPMQKGEGENDLGRPVREGGSWGGQVCLDLSDRAREGAGRRPERSWPFWPR